MDFANTAEDIIKQQLLKNVQKLLDEKFKGKVPDNVLDPAIEILKKELEDITIFGS